MKTPRVITVRLKTLEGMSSKNPGKAFAVEDYPYLWRPTQIMFMCVAENLPGSQEPQGCIGLLANDYSSGLAWDFRSS